MTRVRHYLATTLLALGLLGPGLLAQEPPPAPPPQAATAPADARAGSQRVGNVVIEFDRISVDQKGDRLLEGAVTIRVGDGEARMQADRMVWREERFVEAEGNVLVVWGGNRISGTKMVYDLKEDRGHVEDAVGVVEPHADAPLFFTADRAEKIGDDLVVLDRAVVTTCTQPVPYWSFSVSHATVRLDHYAHLRNVRLRARRLPILYLPYLLWPVKPDRSAGLLFPEFGSTRDRGEVFGLAYFMPLGRSADIKLTGEHYTKAGTGGGMRVRFIPNERGTARFEGFYIDDEIFGASRHQATYQQVQTFANGMRLVADLNEVSDFTYFTDYERELSQASSPQVLARLELTRNGRWTSINVRELRREQLFAGGDSRVQQTLPEIEVRGRSRRLGRSPLYLSFESSGTAIEQFGAGTSADYYRGDLFPTLTAPWSPLPWLDVSPSVSWRGTAYTQSRLPGTTTTVDESVSRSLFRGGVEVVGPKLYRIYGGEEGGKRPRYKNVVEPHVGYEYRSADSAQARILQFDEVDTLTNATNQLNYGLRSRLFARRPRAELKPDDTAVRPVTLDTERSGGSLSEVDPAASTAQEETAKEGTRADAPQEPVEILSLEVRQSRSLTTDLRTEDRDEDGVLDPGEDADLNGILDRSRYSNLEMIGRFNPGPAASVDLRGSWDPLFDQISEMSLSGNVYSPVSRTAFSVVRRTGVGPEAETRTQIRLAAGVALWSGKVRLDSEGTYDLEENRVPDQKYRLEFYTQCCGFLAEYLARDFTVLARREFRFTVDLRGIGKLFDLHEASE
jgi:LPS-assembly protein